MLLRLIAICLLGLTCSGCATATVVAAASAIGTVGGAIDTSASVYGMGKLDSAEMATLDECSRAVRTAAGDLGLELMSEKTRGDGTVRLQYVDVRHKVTDLWIEPRAPKLTLVQIDVGLFGSEATARLLNLRIRKHLDAIQGRPAVQITTQPATQPMTRPTPLP